MTTPIPNFYAKKSIFVTGATGFIGKVLVEKLLYECPDITKIYILLRPKRGKSPEQRLDEFMKCEYFKTCGRVCSETLKSKIEVIAGDICVPKLGLSQEDRQKIIENVSIVFHSAASVKFDDPLKDCLNFNVLGTKSVMDLCKELNHLVCFVHVSTAYAYCHLSKSEETVYDMKVTADQMLAAAQWLDPEVLTSISSTVSEGRPNTYTFTKALAEQYIKENKGDLPVAIARPSIVTAAWKGAAPGWVDSYNGPGALVLLGALGIARSMRINPAKTADLIPVDVVANSLISIAWYTAISRTKSNDLKIYNITTGTTNPVTWHDYLLYSRNMAIQAPSIKTVRPPAAVVGGNGVSPISHFLTTWLSEVPFACIVDMLLMLAGKKAIMVNVVKRMHHALSLLTYFCRRSWSFPCNNLLSLIDFMSKNASEDLKTFYIDTRDIKWEEYTGQCYMGIRKYLLKEADDTIDDARRKVRRIKAVYYSVLVFFFYIALWNFYRIMITV